MKLFQMVIITILLCISSLFSQVNTEAMRNQQETPGINQNLDFSFVYISGNSDIMILNGNYRIDFHSKSKWHGFFVMKYDRAFEKSKDDFTNKGFGHLRTLNHFRPHIDIEFFIQKEFNYYLELENRELIGGVLRFIPVKQFSIGIGVMNETEIYQNTLLEEQNFIKSTNYINYSVQPMPNVTIKNILYYQFKLKEMDHYRILWDGQLSFKGADWLSFYINYLYRYDVSDINSNGSSYFEISNGLGFHF